MDQEVQALKKQVTFLLNHVFQLTSNVDMLTQKVDKLTQENIELHKELAFYKSGRNSSNSSMPPSSDIKPPNRNLSLREKSGKKPGGQKGHEGSTLQMNANPDQVIKHSPQECEACGKNISGQDQQMVSRGQLIELPPIKPFYIEHQIYSRICSCGHCTRASFPQGVSATIKYGSSVEAMIAYLHARQYIPIPAVWFTYFTEYGH
jgi:transposase